MKHINKWIVVISLCVIFFSCSIFSITPPQTNDPDTVRAWMREMGMIPHGLELNPKKTRAIERAVNAYIHKENLEQDAGSTPTIGEKLLNSLPQQTYPRVDSLPHEYMRQASNQFHDFMQQEHALQQAHFYYFSNDAAYKLRVMQRIQNIYCKIYASTQAELAINRLGMNWVNCEPTYRDQVFSQYERHLDNQFFYSDGSLKPIESNQHMSEFFYSMLKSILPSGEFNAYLKSHPFPYQEDIRRNYEDGFKKLLTHIALGSLAQFRLIKETFNQFPSFDKINNNKQTHLLREMIKACRDAQFSQAENSYLPALAGCPHAHPIFNHLKQEHFKQHYDQWGIANKFGQDPVWRNKDSHRKNQLISQIPPAQLNEQLMVRDQRTKQLRKRFDIPNYKDPDVLDVLYEFASCTDAEFIHKLHQLQSLAETDPELKQTLDKLNRYLPQNTRTVAGNYEQATHATKQLDTKIANAKSEAAKTHLQNQKDALDRSISRPFNTPQTQVTLNDQAHHIINTYGQSEQEHSRATPNSQIQAYIQDELTTALNKIATDPHVQNKDLLEKFYTSTLDIRDIAQQAAQDGDYEKACTIAHFMTSMSEFSEHVHKDDSKTLEHLQRLMYLGADALDSLPKEHQDIIQAGAHAILSDFDDDTIRSVLSNMATTQDGKSNYVIETGGVAGHVCNLLAYSAGFAFNATAISFELNSLVSEENIFMIVPITLNTCACIRDIYGMFSEINAIGDTQFIVHGDGTVEKSEHLPEINQYVDQVTYGVVMVGMFVQATNFVRSGYKFAKEAWKNRNKLRMPRNPLKDPTPKLPKSTGNTPNSPTKSPMAPEISTPQKTISAVKASAEIVNPDGAKIVGIAAPPATNVAQTVAQIAHLKTSLNIPTYTPVQQQEVQKGYKTFASIFNNSVDETTQLAMQKHDIKSGFRYDLDHCLNGHIGGTSKKPKLTGLHSTWLHKDCVEKQISIANPTSEPYLALVKKNGLEKQSTMWPDSYGPEDISRDTAEALVNIEHRKMDKGFFVIQGRAKSGILIDTKLDYRGNFDTSYPALMDKDGVFQVKMPDKPNRK